MDGAKRLAIVNWVADFLVQDQAHRGINHVFFFFTTTAEHLAGAAHLLTLDAFNKAPDYTEDRRTVPGLGQALRIINDTRVATLLRDDLAKFLQGRLAADELVCQRAAL